MIEVWLAYLQPWKAIRLGAITLAIDPFRLDEIGNVTLQVFTTEW